MESIGMAYCSKWKEFTTDLGVQVTEELKLITKVEWDELFTQIKVSKIQRRKFNVAIDSLNATGPADPTINKPLPLKHESTKKCSGRDDVPEKVWTSNKRKAGNASIMDHCKVKSKQVIDMTTNHTESNPPKSKAMLAIKNDLSWQAWIEDQDKRENINKLSEPAHPHERNLWNLEDLNEVNLEELPDEPDNNSKLEDYLGCYALLGVNLCRKTSPAEINKHYRIKKCNSERMF